MIKTFCDQCGVELPGDQDNRVVHRLKRKHKHITVEIIVATDGAWNSGAACKDCVLEAVAKGKP